MRDTITLIEPAKPPTSPSSPNVKLTVAIAIILGLILNGGLALLHHAVSDRIESAEELERATGHPVIAAIPTLRFADRIPAVERAPSGRAVVVAEKQSRAVASVTTRRALVDPWIALGGGFPVIEAGTAAEGRQRPPARRARDERGAERRQVNRCGELRAGVGAR